MICSDVSDELPRRLNWYVSHAGLEDGQVCGRSRDQPCRQLDYVIELASEHDVIYIDDVRFNQSTHWLNCDGSLLSNGGRVLKLLTLVGSRSRPRISCDAVRFPDSLPTVSSTTTLQPEIPVTCSLFIDNSTFVNIDLKFDNCNVTITRSLFVRATIGTAPRCRHFRLLVTDSWWYGGRSAFNSTSGCISRGAVNSATDITTATKTGNNMTCDNVDVTFERVEFVHGSVRIEAIHSAAFRMTRSRFVDEVTDPYNQFMGGLHLRFNALSASVQITESNFTNQVRTIARYSLMSHFILTNRKFLLQ